METVEQINQDFNVKKPKKKGLIIGGIIAAVVVVALVLVYFLVLNNPKFIFSKAIDKILAVDSESYESIKMNTEIKASVDLADTTYQEELAEIEKYTLKAGTQMDVEKKQEIVDLGLEYDNQAVIDAQVYYNDGDMYAYFEDIFDKYIELDMDEETKTMLDEVFEMATSEEDLKNTEKAIGIVRDELKDQIKENGEFEKKKDKIEIGEDEVKVTKSTVTLTEKQLWKIATNMLSNLSDNEEFIECFEGVEDYTGESIKDALKEAANEMKDLEGGNNDCVEISLYTKGFLNNELVAIAFKVYTSEDAFNDHLVISVIKEDKNVYSFNVSMRFLGEKADIIKGKVEIEKDKDTKKEQSGKTIIALELADLDNEKMGNIKLEIDYSAEFNQGIDKIDTSNSVNMNALTDAEMQGIMAKLMERPLIKDLLESQMSSLGEENAIVETPNLETPTVENPIIDNNTTTQTQTTTTQNEVKDYGYLVTYSVPSNFVYSEYSSDYMKFYDFEDVDYSYIDATVSLSSYTESEYIQEEINWDYKYYTDTQNGNYTNVNLSQIKTLVVGDKTFKYAVLSYDTEYGTKCYDVYVWYVLDNDHMFTVTLEGTDKEVTEDIIKGFLNINVTKNN